MSCCDEQKPADQPPPTLESIMANLPTTVLAASDPRHPLASSIRNAFPPAAKVKVNDDGSIEYDRASPEPTHEITGYRRDPENPWVYWPLWAECQLRMAGVKVKAEAVEIKMVCNNPALPLFMKFVKPLDCASCTQRKNPA